MRKVVPSKSTAPLILMALPLLAIATAVPVLAQDEESDAEDYGNKAQRTTAITGGAAAASERARQKREAAKQAEGSKEVPALYPLATRKVEAPKSSSKGGKALNEILALYDAQKYAEAIAKAEELANSASANAYEKSFAYQLAANAAADAADDAKAAAYFQKALDINGLDNNGHYQVMYNLAVVQYGSGDNARALATLERFLAETKAEKPDYVALKAALLGNLDRTAEAAALYEQVLAKNPGDKKTLMNAVALYQQSDNFAKANALLKDAQARGLLTEPNEYRALYIGAINEGKLKEAVALIDEGLAKGAIKPSVELANDYQVIAQNAYAAEDAAMAIDLFKRAAPIAKDGEAYLNLAKVLLNEGRAAEARQAAQQALDKGVKKPDDAKRILGAAKK